MKMYISGKVSGLPLEQVHEKFNLAEVRLRMVGHDPVNPMKLNPTPGLTWEEYMLTDIKHLFKCDAILMLPDWGESKGARIERAIAQEHGIKLAYMDDIFLQKLFINAINEKIKGSLDNERQDLISRIAEKMEIPEEKALEWAHEYKQYGLY